MLLKASPEDQAILLDLQAIDTKLQQLAHKANSLPELATIVSQTAEAEEARRAGVTDSGALEDARTELKRVESDVEVVEARIKRDTQRRQCHMQIARADNALVGAHDSLGQHVAGSADGIIKRDVGVEFKCSESTSRGHVTGKVSLAR